MTAIQIAADINTDFQINKHANAGMLLKRLLLPSPLFEVHGKYTNSRSKVENYIAQHFEHVYGANICSFLPTLMTMRCKSSFSAAVGIRKASYDKLFLEQYLNAPIEESIESTTGNIVNRNEIVEIGNLVATKKGASQLLFILLAASLLKTNNKWMVFTATKQVSKILHRLNFKTIILCEADQGKLDYQNSTAQWGEYYNTKPQVLAGDLTQVFDLIHNNRIISYVVKHYEEVVNTLASHFDRQGA